MMRGIGTDIIEVARIRAILDRYPARFLKRVFTPDEQAYCLKRKEPALHFAGRFAAKEAIVKALGTGFSQGLSWLDIEIRHDAHGKPCVALSLLATKMFDHPTLHVSLSHCHHYATAVAIFIQ